MCFPADALPPDLPRDRVLARCAGGAAAERLTLRSADGTEFAAAFAECPEPEGPAVIILPDVRGLYRFYIELAERFVLAGHHAIAIDYFGRSAGTGERDDEFDFWPHIAETSPRTIQEDIAAAREALAERTGAASFVTVGFCFGGAHSYIAAGNEGLGLDAVVGFYGTLDGERRGLPGIPTPLASATATRVPLLGLFGGADPGIPADDVALFDQRLNEAGVEHQLVSFPGAPHSFFDRSFDEYAEDSEKAWGLVLDFLRQVPAPAGP